MNTTPTAHSLTAETATTAEIAAARHLTAIRRLASVAAVCRELCEDERTDRQCLLEYLLSVIEKETRDA
jgi:hypothetical protein